MRHTSTACATTATPSPYRSTRTPLRSGGWAPMRRGATARCVASRSPTQRSCVRLTPPPSDDTADLLVIGAGVMGHFTAYHAAARGARVVVLERGRIGDPMTASYGRTRSFRNY